MGFFFGKAGRPGEVGVLTAQDGIQKMLDLDRDFDIVRVDAESKC